MPTKKMTIEAPDWVPVEERLWAAQVAQHFYTCAQNCTYDNIMGRPASLSQETEIIKITWKKIRDIPEITFMIVLRQTDFEKKKILVRMSGSPLEPPVPFVEGTDNPRSFIRYFSVYDRGITHEPVARMKMQGTFSQAEGFTLDPELLARFCIEGVRVSVRYQLLYHRKRIDVLNAMDAALTLKGNPDPAEMSRVYSSIEEDLQRLGD